MNRLKARVGMGAWGSGVFENDDASDWLDDLEESDRSLGQHVESVLDDFDDAFESGYLEIDVCSQVIAACAALVGDLPPECREVLEVEDAPKVDAGLMRRAASALDEVLKPESEWSELWDEEEVGNDARSAAESVRNRLRAL